jgi:hypothetical protein
VKVVPSCLVFQPCSTITSDEFSGCATAARLGTQTCRKRTSREGRHLPQGHGPDVSPQLSSILLFMLNKGPIRASIGWRGSLL